MVIGLVGFLGSGKGAVADTLKLYNFIPESFANPLKDAVAIIFGWDRSLLEGDTKESREFRETVDEFWSNEFGWVVTPRKILQMMGTEAVRNGIHDNTWVSSFKKRIDPLKNYVISDVRFPNEIQAIRDMGGFIVEISNPKVEPKWLGDVRKDIEIRLNLATTYESLSLTTEEIDYIQKKYPGAHYSEWARFTVPNNSSNYIIYNTGTLEELYANIHVMLKVFMGPDSVDLPLHSRFSMIQ
jgi:hypothetical protein